MVMALLIFMTVCSVINHAGWEIFPKSWLKGPLGEIFITASHHNVHHRDYQANYALYFRFWDKLMGTDKGLDPALFGNPSTPASGEHAELDAASSAQNA